MTILHKDLVLIVVLGFLTLNLLSFSNYAEGVVTRDSEFDEDLTIEEAILGCRDLTSYYSGIKLEVMTSTCDMIMASIFNYCLNHMFEDGASENNQICYDDLMDDVNSYIRSSDHDILGQYTREKHNLED